MRHSCHRRHLRLNVTSLEWQKPFDRELLCGAEKLFAVIRMTRVTPNMVMTRIQK